MTCGFCFVGLDEIINFEQMRTIDVIGVIIQVGSISLFMPKNGGRSKDKRTLCIVDDSGIKILLTLWGNNANKENY
jgi:ssDNA-binding replication factor A large subunit